jgi:GNAT superfamily N-acetyltransferase
MAPYPKEWERHVHLPDGEAVLIRPIRPDDEPLYGPFVARVSAEDVRMRFFGPVKEFNHAFLERFTHVDYEHAIAFIALDEASGAMLGVARLHAHADRAWSGEYAIIVRSDLKGHGLGWLLMQQLIAFARAKGFRSIDGQVLHENKTMLDMCRQLGFDIRINAAAPGISDVRLELAPNPT